LGELTVKDLWQDSLGIALWKKNEYEKNKNSKTAVLALLSVCWVK